MSTCNAVAKSATTAAAAAAAVVILSGKRGREAGTKAVNRVTVDWGEHACVS